MAESPPPLLLREVGDVDPVRWEELAARDPGSTPLHQPAVNRILAGGIRGAHPIWLEVSDSRGVLHGDRTDLNAMKQLHVADTAARTLAEAMHGAHVFIGVSVADCLTADDVRVMAEYPAIFAMANPDPEIDPAVVAETLGDKPFVMATGRSDYPNQVNNVLGFPFIFRGALDSGATKITIEMKVAAAEALADVAKMPVPEQVKACYAGEHFEFGPGYVIPKPFDDRLFTEVSYRVAAAAEASGVGRLPENYRSTLEARNAARLAARAAK